MIIATFKAPSSSSKHRLQFESVSSGEDEEVQEVEPGVREDIYGWAYVGSANFTPSAWGTLSGSSFNPTLNVSCSSFILSE